MTRNALIGAAVAGSFALLAGAFAFQAMGYPPCAMCWWQRYPHMVAILLGVLALAASDGLAGAVLPVLGAVAAATTAGLGLYHTGVERSWWSGPASCTGTGGLGSGDLLSLDGPRLVLCDQVSWEWLGLSMASWNAVLSVILVVLWVLAARRSSPALHPSEVAR